MPFPISPGRCFTGFLKIRTSGSRSRAIKTIQSRFLRSTVMCLWVILLAKFNQLDLLEISINGADVSELLSLTVGSVVGLILAQKPLLLTNCFKITYK